MKFVPNIQKNDQLISLEGLSSLSNIGGSLYVSENNSLLSLDGLESVSSALSARIFLNSSLGDFCSLATLVASNPGLSWQTENNLFNPTMADIESGTCSN